jgi:pSer/pThr/pTyr-binding forkhead associated (FHA) protein
VTGAGERPRAQAGPAVRFRVRAPPGRNQSAAASAPERLVEVPYQKQSLRLGRAVDLDICLPFATVSSIHARIFERETEWALEDLGGTNGTWLWGQRLVMGRPHPLSPGDEFRVGNVPLIFLGPTPTEDEPPGVLRGTGTIARRLVADLFGGLQATEVAAVRLSLGPDALAPARMVLRQPGKVYRVGRAPDCDLVLNDPDASREHVGFARQWDGVFVHPLHAKNPVELRGENITAPTRLADGDQITFARTRLVVEDPEERYLREIQTMDAQAADVAELVEAPAAAAAREASGGKPPAGAPATPGPEPGSGAAVSDAAEADDAGPGAVGSPLIEAPRSRSWTPVVLTLVAVATLLVLLAFAAYLALAGG